MGLFGPRLFLGWVRVTCHLACHIALRMTSTRNARHQSSTIYQLGDYLGTSGILPKMDSLVLYTNTISQHL